MAIKLKCQACQDAVTAQDADRGSTVKCGTCWADVPVPKAETAPPPARPAPAAQPILKATPLPATGGAAPVVAKALPLPSDSAPVVATALPMPAPASAPVKPATLNPVGERERRSDRSRDDRDEKRSKFKTRDRDDDEDDDRPRRTASGGGGKGVMIAFICLGAVVLLGVVGTAVVLLTRGGNDDPVASGGSGGTDNFQPFPFDGGNNAPKPNLNPNPNRPQPGDFNPNDLAGGGPNPNIPKPQPGGAVAGWRTFQAGGFSVLSPAARMVKDTSNFAYGGKSFSGSKYEANEGGGLEVHAWELGMPDGVSVTSEEFVAAATFNLKEKITKSGGRPQLPGPAVEFTTTEINFENGAVVVSYTDDKVFVFRIRWRNAVADGPKKRDEFLNSIRILNAPVVNNRPNPFDPNPRRPDRPNPIAVAWKPVENKSGFAADAPPGVTKEKQTIELDGRVLVSGMKYTASDDGYNYWLFHHDLPPDRDDLVDKIARKLVHDVFPHEVNGSEQDKLDGKPATKWTIRHFHGGLSTGYSVKLGYRLFTFFVTSKQGIYQRNGDPTIAEREKKFFAAIKLPFDPKTADPYADEPKWVAMAKANGFGVLVPRNATVIADKQVGFGFGQDVTMGKEFVTDVDGITYTVTVHVATPKLSVEKIATELRGRETVSNSGQVKVNGLTFENYELKHFFGHPILFRATAVGNTVFTLRTVRSEQFGKSIGDKEFADKSAKFFDSFRIGAAPVDGAGGGAVAAAGEFVQLAAGKVKPFWGAVFLTNAKELVTVGVRDPLAASPGGILRRYSVPDFKLKATYHMALPAHRVVADEKGGKLYVATVSTAADAKLSEREAAIVSGEIQVFDLKQILSGTIVELDPLKSTANLYVGAQVSGLKVTPLGDAVYVSCVVLGGTKARPAYRGKLIKFDTATNKGTDLTCEAPVWAMDLSYDGRRLAVVERPLPAAPGRGGNLVFIDGPNWKRLKAVPLTGDPTDVAYIDNRAGVLENTNGTLKATVVDPDGESSELPLAGDVRYLKATPDGKKLLASAGLPSNGLIVYTADGAKPPKWTLTTSAADLGGTALGGMGTLSADGKLLALNGGVVIDLGASGGK